jgi:hypothetical protein
LSNQGRKRRERARRGDERGSEVEERTEEAVTSEILTLSAPRTRPFDSRSGPLLFRVKGNTQHDDEFVAQFVDKSVSIPMMWAIALVPKIQRGGGADLGETMPPG